MKGFIKLYRNQKLLIVLFGIVAALLGFVISYSLAEGKKNVTGSSCEGTCINLQEKGAAPSAVTVVNGSYVQFNSADGRSHSLSLGGGGHDHDHHGQFSSGEFGADEAWRVQFKDDGTYQFHDHLNPEINIVVVVYTPGKEYKVE